MAKMWLTFLPAFVLLASMSEGKVLPNIQTTALCKSYGGECRVNRLCDSADDRPNARKMYVGQCDERGSRCCLDNRAVCERWIGETCDMKACSYNITLSLTLHHPDCRACCVTTDWDGTRGVLDLGEFIRRFSRVPRWSDAGNSTIDGVDDGMRRRANGEVSKETGGKRGVTGGRMGRVGGRRKKGTNHQMRGCREMMIKHKEQMGKRMGKMEDDEEDKKMKKTNKKLKATTSTPKVYNNSTAACMSLNGQCLATPDECNNLTRVVTGSCDDVGSVCCADASKMQSTKVSASDNSSGSSNSSGGGSGTNSSGSTGGSNGGIGSRGDRRSPRNKCNKHGKKCRKSRKLQRRHLPKRPKLHSGH
ncbi:hypothetical protein LSAT2_010246 [Lamellibrachia satsuma]|nr:hypothetical protein LSAT2_010246 [Lamellibrachia satsuma]